VIEIGTTGLQLISSARVYDPASGDRTLRRYKGNHDDVLAQYQSLLGSAYRVSIEPIEGTPKSILTIDEIGAPGGNVDENVQTVWTLQSTVEDAPLAEHPKFKAVLSLMPDEGLAQFNADLDEWLSGTVPSAWSGGLGGLGDLEDYVRLRGEGVDTWQRARYTLRKVKTVAANSAIVVSHANVLRYYTGAQIGGIDGDAPPTALIGTLPAGHWLKMPPQIDQLSNGRYTLSQEWWYGEIGEWDPRIYQAATP